MRVLVTVDQTTLENDKGYDVASIVVTCDRCDHSVEVFGTGEQSIRRGCAMLREECPEDEDNFYTEES